MNRQENETRRNQALPAARLGALVLCMFLPVPVASAGGPAEGAPAQAPPSFGTNAAVVRLDVIVRDKKGRIVRDLRASDFEVLEDGAEQTIESFRMFSRDEPRPPSEAAQAPEGTSSPEAGSEARPPEAPPSVVAFVFDRMSPEARNLSRRAALAHLDGGGVRGCLVGVFSIDLALHLMEPFTTDPAQVRVGLERAASQGSAPFSQDATETRRRVDTLIQRSEILQGMSSSGGQSNPATAGRAATLAVENIADTVDMNVQRATELLERDQQGFATTNSLLDVVEILERAPGRKAIVLLSEGLKIPGAVQDRFRTLIAAANRAQVSVYALDTGGLRITSPLDEANQELFQFNAMRVMDATADLRLAAGPLSRQGERVEELIHFDPRVDLGRLADETGGVLIHDTNDASAGLARIGEDMRFHYLLSYAPTNQKLDGTLRQVSVRVRRPRVVVQSRKSYSALPATAPARELKYEARAFAQLDRRPRPIALALRMIALSFPESRRPGLVPVLVEVPQAALGYAPLSGGVRRADVTIVVRIKGEGGEEVARLSDRYLLPPPRPKAPRGPLQFYREVDLAPGRYTVESAAYDAGSQRTGTTTWSLEVPAVSEQELRLSSLVLANGAEPVPADAAERPHPLRFGGVFLHPNLGEPLQRATSPVVGFFFTAYGDPQAPATREASIELRRGDRKLRSATTALNALDAEGRVQHAGTVSLEALEPGPYTLAVTVTDGRHSNTRQASFVLER